MLCGDLRFLNTRGNKKVELFDTGAGVSGEPTAEENVQMASCESLSTSVVFSVKLLRQQEYEVAIGSLKLPAATCCRIVNHVI